jgi:hypothetical protein
MLWILPMLSHGRMDCSNTCFVSYDICFDNTVKAGVLYNIRAAVTNFERCMSSSIHIHYTERLSRSQRWSESSLDLRATVFAYILHAARVVCPCHALLVAVQSEAYREKLRPSGFFSRALQECISAGLDHLASVVG